MNISVTTENITLQQKVEILMVEITELKEEKEKLKVLCEDAANENDICISILNVCATTGMSAHQIR